MPDPSLEPVDVEIGGLSRTGLLDTLRSAGVALNAHAETLISHPIFGHTDRETVRIVARTVEQLGLREGATLPQIFTAAEQHGLALCPAVTGPYLRLAWAAQSNSSDSVMSVGNSPDGALNVASPVLTDDVEYPKGFYLRVVDGQPWLRGYRCDDLHVFSPDVRFAFRQP